MYRLNLKSLRRQAVDHDAATQNSLNNLRLPTEDRHHPLRANPSATCLVAVAVTMAAVETDSHAAAAQLGLLLLGDGAGLGFLWAVPARVSCRTQSDRNRVSRPCC